MIKPLLAAALLASLSGCYSEQAAYAQSVGEPQMLVMPQLPVSDPPAPPVINPVVTGDPVKDALLICSSKALENLERVRNGDAPDSDIDDFYSEAFKLDEAKAVRLKESCAMFEAGFLLGYVAGQPDPAVPNIRRQYGEALETTF